MRLDLPAHVHAVMIDDDLVLLDVEADAYFCLPLPAGLLRQGAHGLETEEAAIVRDLAAAGLARAAGEGPVARRPPPPAIPQRTARATLEYRQDRVRVRPAHLRALALAARAALASRRMPFAALLAPPKGPADEGAPARLLDDLAVWRGVSPWLPLDGVCLFRSGMLLAFLRALGHRPSWVFGVRTWPFRAHCWLQAGDLALDDEAERLAAYAPILAA
ncbi:lasso peptide biosynthesis B2 protein [Caulobacter hibisci]|uniref:Lasso peptide biosynthesis B2 protein n=1 Tax=Caulobacter hibisci TaxID=2035993 RepID=A0ABS0T4I5_9CAUL|nr:lasso peptide biosynthesis B2 protein [Caulobacter hibisci]MBI1686793.1 lasso peptide biosynthesis B2 protein [Caulobacter hibisci]